MFQHMFEITFPTECLQWSKPDCPMYYFTKREIKTSLTPALFIEVSVPSQGK